MKPQEFTKEDSQHAYMYSRGKSPHRGGRLPAFCSNENSGGAETRTSAARPNILRRILTIVYGLDRP